MSRRDEGAENEPVLLTVAEKEADACMICDLLAQEGIPAMKRYRGANQALSLYTGAPNIPCEIYAPKSAKEKALSILETFSAPADEAAFEEMAETAEAEGADDPSQNRRSAGMYGGWFLALAAVVALAFLAALVSLAFR